MHSLGFGKQFFSEPLSQHSRSLKLRELPARFFGGLSNPSGAISRKLALPAPDGPHNQIESKPDFEVDSGGVASKRRLL
jgi:hypothetical protein